MRTGLTKKQKITVIYFDEYSRIIEVQTHNTDLKKRLAAFAAKYPVPSRFMRKFICRLRLNEVSRQ